MQELFILLNMIVLSVAMNNGLLCSYKLFNRESKVWWIYVDIFYIGEELDDKLPFLGGLVMLG